MAQVLLVEDDAAIRTTLTRALREQGHSVTAIGAGLPALTAAVETKPDVVLLDLGLPDVDGADILSMLRAVSDVPVIVATARDDESEMVRVLDIGADDYVIKPFTASQLNARIRAVLRRMGRTDEDPVITVGGLVIDTRSYEVTVDGRPVELARKEFELLLALARRAGEVVSKRDLLSEVWQLAWGGSDRTVDVHLSWLRRKLGESRRSAAVPAQRARRGRASDGADRRLTVRRRILLLVVGMTTLVVLAFAIPLMFLTHSVVGSNADTSIGQQATGIANSLRATTFTPAQVRTSSSDKPTTPGTRSRCACPTGRSSVRHRPTATISRAAVSRRQRCRALPGTRSERSARSCPGHAGPGPPVERRRGRRRLRADTRRRRVRNGPSERVSELDVVSIKAPRVPLCWWGAACNLTARGCRQPTRSPASTWRGAGSAYQFTILRLVARPADAGHAGRDRRGAADDEVREGRASRPASAERPDLGSVEPPVGARAPGRRASSGPNATRSSAARGGRRARTSA